MRKLILFSIPLFYSLTISRTLLVPEEFLTIQQAVVVAQNEDTVSVNFGCSNGLRVSFTASRIFGKEITFEVRGKGEEELLEMASLINNPPNTDSYPPPGWQGARWVYDSLHRHNADASASIKLDRDLTPWIIGSSYEGHGGRLAKKLAYTNWLGNSWDSIKYIEEIADSLARLQPDFTFDENNVPFVVYDKYDLISSDDIFFTRRVNNQWFPEAIVNLPDSTERDFSPEIDCDGSEMWCAWYGGFSPYSSYDIFVSRWDGNNWEQEQKISPPVGSNEYLHWWCDIAVDGNGHPHVVWAETWFTRRIYYRTFNESTWEEPVVLNDTSVVKPIGWPLVNIARDLSDNLYVVWIGLMAGDSVRNIFYNVYNQSSGEWSAPARLRRIDNYPGADACIAASSLNDIWMLWNKEIRRGTESQLYISHFDGHSWSDELRIDPGFSTLPLYSKYSITLDDQLKPWILFTHFTGQTNIVDLYYDRYIGIPGIKDSSPCKPLLVNAKRNLNSLLKDADVYDIKGEKISNTSSLSAGVYFYLFRGKDRERAKLIILR